MTWRTVLFLFMVVFCVAVSYANAGYLITSPEYQVEDVIFPIPYAWSVYGFDVVPGGFVAFIDRDIVRISDQGQISSPLFSFPDFVYGSFVKVAGSQILFGESSNGTIWSMGLDGSNPTMLGVVPNNYDLEFNLTGTAFVSANPGWVSQKIVLLNGGQEIVTGLSGYSGPLIFDSLGNLLYATAFAAGGDKLLKFGANAVAQALQGNVLTESDGNILSAIPPASDMAIDIHENIFLTSGNTLYKLSTPMYAPIGIAASQQFLTTLRCTPSDSRIFVLIGGAEQSGTPVGVISVVTPVPEPSSLISLFSLVGGWVFFRKKAFAGRR